MQDYLFNFVIHSNLHLARVSVVAYAKWRLSFNVSECKQSGPYELLSNVRLTAAGKRITRCLFDEWKRVREMCSLAHTHVERQRQSALKLTQPSPRPATRDRRHCPLCCYATARFSHSAVAPSSFPSSPASWNSVDRAAIQRPLIWRLECTR